VRSPRMGGQGDEEELRLRKHQGSNLRRGKPWEWIVDIDRSWQNRESDAATVEGAFHRRISSNWQCIEDPITAADDCLTVANRVPRETYPRPEIVQVFASGSGRSNVRSETRVIL